METLAQSMDLVRHLRRLTSKCTFTCTFTRTFTFLICRYGPYRACASFDGITTRTILLGKRTCTFLISRYYRACACCLLGGITTRTILLTSSITWEITNSIGNIVVATAITTTTADIAIAVAVAIAIATTTTLFATDLSDTRVAHAPTVYMTSRVTHFTCVTDVTGDGERKERQQTGVYRACGNTS